MEETAWERVDASSWDLIRVESSGSSESLWLRDPVTSGEWLHKDTKIPANGVEQGEDWSEVIATQVAKLIGIPCADTRLCLRHDRRGSLSKSVRPDTHALWEGAVVLEASETPGFFRQIEGEPEARDPARPDVKRPGHTLENIRSVLTDAMPPPGFAGPETMSAYDVFAGYMMLDALIANPDRHEQNWATLVPHLQGAKVHLAPSYDHASSLGHNLTDKGRRSVMDRPDGIPTWVAKGTARRYEHVGLAPTLVDHAVQAMTLCSAEGVGWWRQQINDVDLAPVFDAVERGVIEEMSVEASRFAIKVLEENVRRIRDAI